ncbi:hypothetical protein Trydic_g16384 [Trypoxylus dichotomus]
MGTAINHAAAIKRLEALFENCRLDKRSSEIVQVEQKRSIKCDIHGKNGLKRGSLGNLHNAATRRGSLGNANSKSSLNVYPLSGVGPRRESMPALNLQSSYNRRRESLGLPHTTAKKDMEHPSNFPSTLRKSEIGASTGSLKRDLCFGSWNTRRDSLGGSTNSLRRDGSNQQLFSTNKRNSRRFSTDSLDTNRNSWDPNRRGSSGSSCSWDSPLIDDLSKFSSHNFHHVFGWRMFGKSGWSWQDIDIDLFEPVCRRSRYVRTGFIRLQMGLQAAKGMGKYGTPPPHQHNACRF